MTGRFYGSVVAAGLLLGAAGCQTPMRTVISLENSTAVETASTRPVNHTVRVTEKGTYKLYASVKDESDKLIYETDLTKGEDVGFQAKGDLAQGIAGGKRIELSDFEKGASYSWKIDEKKKR